MDEFFEYASGIIEDIEGGGLWCLINNAGVAVLGRADWLKLSDFKFTMEVNYFGKNRRDIYIIFDI